MHIGLSVKTAFEKEGTHKTTAQNSIPKYLMTSDVADIPFEYGADFGYLVVVKIVSVHNSISMKCCFVRK